MPTAPGWAARVLPALFTHRQAWVWPGPGPGGRSGKEVPQSRGLLCRPQPRSPATHRLEGGTAFGPQPRAQGGLHPRAGLMASTASWFDLLGLEGRGGGGCRDRLPGPHCWPRAGHCPWLALPPPSPHLSLLHPLPPPLSVTLTGHRPPVSRLNELHPVAKQRTGGQGPGTPDLWALKYKPSTPCSSSTHED